MEEPYRQVAPDLPERLLDRVMMIEQPFGRGRDQLLAPRRLGNRLVVLEDRAFVFGKTAGITKAEEAGKFGLLMTGQPAANRSKLNSGLKDRPDG